MNDFEKIYADYCSLVYNIALNYLQNTQDAEEVTQDVFLKVYNKRESFKNKSSIKTWVYRIAINTSIDYLRKRSRRPILRVPMNEPYVPRNKREWKHPGTLLEEKEAYQSLFSALNQLPTAQKSSIILLKIEGLSQKKAAKVLEINEKALESLFQRAKKALLTIIEKEKNKNNV
tara:strand:- start:39 stop:560 length:522 start_codon:yes stop_codon:yes gene_type:complete